MPKVADRGGATSRWSELPVEGVQVSKKSIHLSERGAAALLTAMQFALELQKGTGKIMGCVILLAGHHLLQAQSAQGHID